MPATGLPDSLIASLPSPPHPVCPVPHIVLPPSAPQAVVSELDGCRLLLGRSRHELLRRVPECVVQVGPGSALIHMDKQGRAAAQQQNAAAGRTRMSCNCCWTACRHTYMHKCTIRELSDCAASASVCVLAAGGTWRCVVSILSAKHYAAALPAKSQSRWTRWTESKIKSNACSLLCCVLPLCTPRPGVPSRRHGPRRPAVGRPGAVRGAEPKVRPHSAGDTGGAHGQGQALGAIVHGRWQSGAAFHRWSNNPWCWPNVASRRRLLVTAQAQEKAEDKPASMSMPSLKDLASSP